MVEPYVAEDLYTSLVMQAQSSNYNVSAAADHALALSETYPDSVVILLKKIQKDCWSRLDLFGHIFLHIKGIHWWFFTKI